MHLMTPIVVQCSVNNFIDFFGPNLKSLSLKGLDRANPINLMFCNNTIPEMH